MGRQSWPWERRFKDYVRWLERQRASERARFKLYEEHSELYVQHFCRAQQLAECIDAVYCLVLQDVQESMFGEDTK